MNVASLAFVGSALTGAIGGGLAAASHSAVWWAVALCALGGLLIGIALGFGAMTASDKMIDLAGARSSKGFLGIGLNLAAIGVSVLSIVVAWFGAARLTAFLVRSGFI